MSNQDPKNMNIPGRPIMRPDYGKWGSESYGKEASGISGPFTRVVPRVSLDGEFNQADRQWRQKFIKDQHLTKKDLGYCYDVLDNPDYRKARFWWFRRMWQKPMDLLEEHVFSKMVAKRVNAYNIRYGLTKVAQFWALGVAVAYYFRHRRGDWTRQEGWKVYRSKTPTYPGHPEWPHNTSKMRTRPDQYSTEGFENSPI